MLAITMNNNFQCQFVLQIISALYGVREMRLDRVMANSKSKIFK